MRSLSRCPWVLPVLVSTFALQCPLTAQAGRRWTALQRKLAETPILKNLVKVPSEPRVLLVAPGEMTLELPNQPVWVAFGKNDVAGDAAQRSKELGHAIARRGFALGTGGGKGLPRDTEAGAYEAGASTIAYSPAADIKAHAKGHDGDIHRTTHLIATGTGKGLGTIAREAPMAQSANRGVASYANGGSGTFGEWIAMLHNEGGVMAFLKGTGGVADSAPGWMKWVDAKPGFQTVSKADPEQLTEAATRAFKAQAPSSGKGATRRVQLVSPGGASEVLTTKETRGRAVAAFLTEDPRASRTVSEATHALVSAWIEANHMEGTERTTVVVPSSSDRALATGGDALALTAANLGADTVVVSPLKGSIHASPMNGRARTAFLGYGEAEMGKFAAARGVAGQADVVFFTSARYQNLSALAYAMRDDRKPVIAVLARSSTFADKLAEMIGVIDPKAAASRLVVASSPRELVAKVKAQLKVRSERGAAEVSEKTLD